MSEHRAKYQASVGAIYTTEREFLFWVLEVAQAFGWRCYHAPDSPDARKLPRGRRGEYLVDPGYPDIFAVRPPRVVVIETKTVKGRLRHGQEEWRADLLRCPGIEFHLWRPGDEAKAQEVLQ